ncbi:MAG: putative glutamine ABC transporter permease protein GlnM [Gammaproteobacteria bacterium]|nr:putative glutamine ABC transporter permease protein GlnM [Gammaproteobacteria bacterium]
MAEHHTKIPWHRNPKVRSIFFQVALLAATVWVAATILGNTVENLEERGIRTGLGFMGGAAPFNVGFSPFIEYKLGESTYTDVFIIGVLNTMLVSVLGIVAATVLGFFIGVLRLSPNWLMAKIASAYIEIFRNVPLLLQIMFWNFAVFLPILPAPRQSWGLGATAFLNNRGLYLPSPIVESAAGVWLMVAAIAATIVGIIILRRWAHRRQNRTGQPFPVLRVALAAVVVVPVLAYFAGGQPFTLDFPFLDTFNFEGGMRIPTPLFALWFALTTYTASFIAEAVRGGILSVSHGQTEAAYALGLNRKRTLDLVIIPQAMRVIIPPTISQYLNLTKNSSLAVAIAYEELVNLWAGIALNQTGQALIIIAMTIAVYETLSLGTSAFLNWYNARRQLVER